VSTERDEELRKRLEDLIVDTTLHPVEASLRAMQLISERDAKRDAYVVGEDTIDTAQNTYEEGYNDRGLEAHRRAKEWNHP
jgi:hypothetical protein